MKTTAGFGLIGLALLTSSATQAQQVEISLELPVIETAQYYRPYVAVWIEDESQQPIRLVALWRKEPDWLKDIRRFWRKIGRSETELVDARTGATRTPGRYQLSWDGLDDAGQPVPAGQYTVLVEASREQGGRSLQRQTIQWGGATQHYTQEALPELGELKITLN